MIKYVELTAPEASAFRQAKIVSVECREGDRVKRGQTLFRVKSGNTEIALPATKEGRVVEIIATLQENITFTTPLLLLETEVNGSTASKPIADQAPVKQAISSGVVSPPLEQPQSKSKTKHAKKHVQQSLNLAETPNQEVILDQVIAPDTDVNQNATSTASNNAKPAVSNTMSKSANIEISVPDIGAESAKVIDILVSVGDTIELEDPLVTLESDKASMDVPSTHAGVVKAISVSVDQDVSEGTVILEVSSTDAGTEAKSKDTKSDNESSSENDSEAQESSSETRKSEDKPGLESTKTSLDEVRIPDIGGDSAKVIEILVEVGQTVELEDALVTLESDKASMDVPSSSAGTIESIEVKVDEEVSEGTLVVTVKSSADSPSAESKDQPKPSTEGHDEKSTDAASTNTEPASGDQQNPKSESNQTSQQGAPAAPQGTSYASPSIRRFARELGVDLSKVSGSGRKQRVTHDDVKAHVKSAMTSKTSQPASTGSGIPPIPAQDFTKFGEIELQPLSKIKRLTATNLHRSWVNVPHVTHNDESDISDLESFRKQLNSEYQKQGKDIKLSPLAFIVKAVVNAMQAYPQFNSSLEPGGENLILKKYFNIGIAVDTPNGLVVPVIKDADKKSVAEIAREMGELASKARDKKLTMADMSGACFTISSLGGIGGTGFTPIVNAPEVAILGVSRSKIQPVWDGEEFKPGMILPLSLSYDHRVIDGAEAARFARHVAAVLEDVRRLTV